MRVVVAMSGGVDSSAVAGLLVEAGHEVIGLSMKTHSTAPKGNRACCTPDDMRDARRVADHLDIPFYILNYEDVFFEHVMAPFAQAYKEGRTPNPCVECNDKVKFRPLLERAKLLGADALATGHYARIVDDHSTGLRYLQRGVDGQKDQSYFLYRLTQDQLSLLMFPLGGMVKAEVRAHAERLGLPVAHKRESQEICFVGEEGYAKTVENISGPGKAGHLINQDGRVLGAHDGIHQFTLGQRRGLRIAAPEPLYVTRIDPVTGNVIVGHAETLNAAYVDVEGMRWSGAMPHAEQIVYIQQRYRDVPKQARLIAWEPDSVAAKTGYARFAFCQPERVGAPGQAAVVYTDDHRVVGGGTIKDANASSQYTPPSRSHQPTSVMEQSAP